MTDEPPRILVIAPQPFYQDRGTPIAVLHLTQALVRAGFGVDVVTFKGGIDPADTDIRIFRAESHWSSSNLPIGLSWRKVVQHFALYRLARKMLRQNEYKAIHAVEESVFTARLLTLRTDIPIVYDMHSWLSDELSQLPALGLWPAKQLICAVERSTVRKVSTIFCSAGLDATANKLLGKTTATEWFFPVQHQPFDLSQKTAIRRSYGIRADCELIVYTGNLATNQNIALLVEAISLLYAKRNKVEVAIVGATGNDAEQLRRDLDISIRPRVHFMERLPRRDALDIMAAADVAVSLRVRGLNAPLKLFDYIGAGVPVAATNVQAHRVILGNAAEYCEPEADDVVRAIERLLDDDARYEEIREQYAEMSNQLLSEETFGSTVAGVYSQLCDSLPASSSVS